MKEEKDRLSGEDTREGMTAIISLNMMILNSKVKRRQN